MFYHHFLTPHLSLHRSENGTNIYLADGRDLLRENLPVNATPTQCHEAALLEITFLALRDLVDIIPLLKPFGNGEWTALPQKAYWYIRYIAFLRGRIPFIKIADLKKVSKKLWPHVDKHIKTSFPERFPGKGKLAQVISCDWACMVCPDTIHEEIYALGKYATSSSFDQEHVFKRAQQMDIIIDTKPRHPLEEDLYKTLSTEQKKEMEQKNKPTGLPSPPEILPREEAENKYGRLDLVAVREQKRVRDELAFNRVKFRIAQDSKVACYKIDTVSVDRHQYMDYIVWGVSEGNRITELCPGSKGTPTLLEVYRWKQMYPDFALGLQAAEEIQAQIFADRALKIAEDVTEKDEIPVAKFKHRALMERASLQAEKFRPKQVIQTEDLDHKNVADLKRQLKVLLQGNMHALSDVIDVETFDQAEGQQAEE